MRKDGLFQSALRFLAAFRRGLLVSLVPATELVLLRGLLSEAPFFHPFLPSYDLCFVMAGFAVFFFRGLEEGSPLALVWRRVWAIFHGLLVLLTIALFFSTMSSIVLLCAVLTVLSGFFLFLTPQDVWRRAHQVPAVSGAGGAIGLLLLAFPFVSAHAWSSLAWVTACLVAPTLGFLGLPVDVSWTAPIHLQQADFSTYVTQPCAGLQGILLALLLVFFARCCGALGRAVWDPIFYALSAAVSFFLNAFRIVGFFAAGVALERHAGPFPANAPSPFAFLHDAVGCVTYLMGLLLFVFVVSRCHKRSDRLYY